jgi:segregation and condensation protein A
MRIKAKMLLPRKELDPQGNEIDPRQELIDKIVEYKRFKEAALKMSELEALRMLMFKRGNIQDELSKIGEEAGEGTEIQAVSLFRLMKAFEKVASRLHEKRHQPVHTVVQYDYTMEGSRKYMLELIKKERSLSFEKIFDVSENRIHAIFLFLNMLELIQQKYFSIITGTGINNFIIEYNEDRVDDIIPLEETFIDSSLN